MFLLTLLISKSTSLMLRRHSLGASVLYVSASCFGKKISCNGGELDLTATLPKMTHARWLLVWFCGCVVVGDLSFKWLY